MVLRGVAVVLALVSASGAAAAGADGGFASVEAAARAADATCTDAACTLTIQQNTHYPKVGYKDLPDSSQAACCAACSADAKCGGFVLAGTTCHLKPPAMGNFEPSQGAVSGLKPCVAKLQQLCIGAQASGATKCHACLKQNAAALQTAKCTAAEETAYCDAPAPSPSPHPGPPGPPPMYPNKPAPPGAKNVLFIISDDMRPSIGAYGLKEAVTPHLDQLAKEGVMFTRAHIQFSYCAPSRNSFMSGRRPDANKVWNFNNNFREKGVGDKWIALPEHFVTNGYLVTGAGKLYHPNVPPNFDQPRSWSPKAPDGSPLPYLNNGDVNGTNKNGTDMNPACQDSNCCGASDPHYCLKDLTPDTFLLDQTVKNIAVDRLNVAMDNWKKTKQPFFVGMGTHRPHLGWEFPIEFEIPELEVPEAAHKKWPVDVPHLHWHECAEMGSTYFDDTDFGVPFPEQNQKQHNFTNNQAALRRAYYGCISYVDSLIGELLQALKDGGADNHTAVVFTGDHGWHLGEHDMWCKMSNLELGTRVPLIFRAPWLKGMGTVSGALAELVDMYPTLSELAGLTLPTGDAGAYLGGTSLVPVLAGTAKQVKNCTISQFPRCYQNNSHHSGGKPGDESNRTVSWESMSDCHWVDRGSIDFMGYKMRTEDWSVTAWSTWDGKALRPIWGSHCGENAADAEPGNAKVGCYELYSHAGDDGMAPAAFDDYENVNLAADPAHKEKLTEMLALLHQEVERWWTPNPPDGSSL